MTVVTLVALSLLAPTPRGGHAIGPDRGGHAVVERPIETGERIAASVGWVAEQWGCMARLGNRESGWDVTKWNRGGSGAYGVGQALPASKMRPFGADYMTSATTQVRWMISYITGRYGTPCNAWAHSNAYGYY